MSETAIQVEKITKSYGDTQALDTLSFEVAAGEMFGLIGPDGAGKTTLMRILASLIDPDEGEARVLGISVRSEPGKVREIIGYMPQRFSLYPDLTVAENLRFFADLFKVPKKERIRKTEELLDFSRLGPFLKRRTAQLSGGMKQKLALSCALIHTPEVLILDEPTTGVDPVSRREFWEILARIRGSGATILVSTPYMDEAARCDRIAFIHRGNVLARGTEEQVVSLFPGKVLAMTGPDLPGLAAWLKETVSPERVQILGEKVQVSIQEEDEERMRKLLDTAGEKGLISGLPERVSPGLEDTFVAFMGND